MAEYIKTCPICGRVFPSICKTRLYCSVECRKISNQAPYAEAKRVCLVCGKKVEDGRYNSCSECMLKFYNKTKSPNAYRSLVKRGFGHMFTINDLNSKRQRLK